MRIIALLCGSLALAGCMSTPQQKPIADDPYYAPVYPAPKAQPVMTTGSLFQQARVVNFYSDSKAHRIGDIIQVQLRETTQAKKSAKNDIKKENKFTLSPVTGGSKKVTINGKELEVGLDQKGQFKGQAGADQSNSLTGSISVHVAQVLENGNLLVRGEKWITLNNGDEFIRLTGMVRPKDISADNVIDSGRIANARIQYSGTGSFANSQQMGWLTQFFNGPLWPF